MFPAARISKYLKSDKRTLSLLHHPHLSMRGAEQIHAHLLVSGAIADPYAAGKLVAFLALSTRGDLANAALLFHRLPYRSAFLWNTMIRAHVDRNQPLEALSLYGQMLSSDFAPNNYTFSFLLRACLDLSSLSDGQKFHAQIVKLGWEPYDFVQNGLIHMYSSCGCIDSACRLFDGSLNRDVISWTAMVNGYAKSGQIDVARELFDRMPERNVVSWSAMITSYAQIGRFQEALDFFNEMQLAGVRPNHAGIVGALSACGSLGALDQGRWIHAFVERNAMELDRVLGTALTDMYAKCGSIETALQVFDAMSERDVFAYTSMISGLSNHGHSEKAIDLFLKMREEGVKPNEVTFICVLSACSRMGLVDQGREIFASMDVVYGIKPGVEHYGCLVDLLGRAGLLEEAKRVVREMPMEPDSYVLGALLNAYREHGEVELGKEAVESLIELGLDHSGVHVLLSNMYASAYRWEDVLKVRKGMEEKKVKKVPGCSMIEVDGVACEFVSGDRSHSQMDEIVSTVKEMDKQLKSSEDSLDWRNVQPMQIALL
ncbi:pentatricopeptide repeat-containing protein At5g66520 [Elaeis guineensis]|uniref:Pentatricopeptide repeat-containing protein At5g66520 n=1 Tax=Elaeis guineensis var. tenera TaxID=51953 RepID=A0A6I9S004_ELAGV|nr:pentatricopeptide repeat-containing protein At5g66520 [Elaeis guineensis]